MNVQTAQDEFVRSLSHVLVHEGGFSNHPKDPGGATMKGVTQRVYDTYRKSMRLPTQSVRGITDIELRAIYRREYWDKMQGDRMASGVSYVVFDGSVMGGDAKAFISDAKAAPTLSVADAATGGGIGSGTMAGVLNEVQAQLTPFSSSSAFVGNVIVALTIAGAALAIGGIGWRWYAKRKRDRLADALDIQPGLA